MADARMKLEKDVAPAMSCIVREDSRRKRRLVQLKQMPVRNSQIHKTKKYAENWSENTLITLPKICGKFSRWPGTSASLHSRKLWNTPEAKAAVELEKLKQLPAWDEQKEKSQTQSFPSSEEGWNNSSRREPEWSSVTWRTPNLRNTSTSSGGETCSRRRTPKRKGDTEQYSQSKALQRLRWQRQNSWTRSQSFLEWLEK